MSKIRILISYSTLAVVAGLLGACGGGSDTVANPDLGPDNTGEYRGPPPATADVLSFQNNFWSQLRGENACLQCHDQDQKPQFLNFDDVNVAYSEAIGYADFIDPSRSEFVSKVGGGHNCWLASNSDCADTVERMIINWANDSGTTTTRTIDLIPRYPIRDPGDAKSFPTLHTDNAPASFEQTVYPVLTTTGNCQGCHDDSVALPIAPFFANSNVASAYDFAKSKMDIDTPSNSRFVVRLRDEFHNCWTNDCAADATAMQTAIEDFANAITPTAVDPSLITTKAMKMIVNDNESAIIASGGSRHESNLAAIWEFRNGSGDTAVDTSGIAPAINLTLSGSYSWLGEYGIDFTGGKAQGDTTDSKKLYDFIRASGEYSIEAWVIPSNVTQEDSNIVSYSAGALQRNFTLGQALYNYQHYNRTNESDANGVEFLSTEDAGEILQSSLQHVVATYHPIDGRSIYVNGTAIAVNDPVTNSTSIADWDDTYAVVFGNEVSNNRQWSGKLRMVAIHNRVLTAEQVSQNFDVGVGQKFFLLFSVSHRLSIPECLITNPDFDSSSPITPDNAENISLCYVFFEVSQFDSFSYLFEKPTFINLNPDWTPSSINIEGMRIGINGKEANAGQVFANLNTTINSTDYSAESGQLLSSLGAVIALEKGSDSDEFFLTFEGFNGLSNVFVDPAGSTPSAGADAAVVSDIGVRTFEEINAGIAAITGIPATNSNVDAVYQQYRQQLPTVESLDAFLPSHQMAIAQIALTSCSELVNTNPGFFTGFNFGAGAATAFDDATKRNQIIDPIIEAAANVDLADNTNNLTIQPTETELRDTLGALTTQDLDAALSGDSYESLITQMTTCPSGCNTTTRTAEVVKAVCAAAVGGAVMLIQ